MQRRFICTFYEMTRRHEDPSIREFFSNRKYPDQELIVRYLRNGKINLVSPGWRTDITNGKIIPGTSTTLVDQEYEWTSDLAYYVEKYNMRLPAEFEEHILKKSGHRNRAFA